MLYLVTIHFRQGAAEEDNRAAATLSNISFAEASWPRPEGLFRCVPYRRYRLRSL